MASHTYALDPSWRAMLADVSIHPADVLRRAGLPEDLMHRPGVRLSTAEFFRFWRGLEAELSEGCLPLRLGEVLSTESFSAPLFAALCSPDLVVACERISQHKPLVAPVALTVRGGDGGEALELELAWCDVTQEPPPSLIAAELVFFVTLARLATREHVVPLEVMAPVVLEPAAAYALFFGVEPVVGPRVSLRVSATDARRPFLTSNASMWELFEPELRRRLAELDAEATVADRVRAVLLEGLPSGQVAMDDVARKLKLSRRTLQRRLRGESTTFQTILQATREALARHYLQQTDLAVAEIAFLLGFEEPNSFYRAFSAWTGQTPDGMRQLQVH